MKGRNDSLRGTAVQFAKKLKLVIPNPLLRARNLSWLYIEERFLASLGNDALREFFQNRFSGAIRREQRARFLAAGRLNYSHAAS
jgi:hypothetical protein